MKKTGSRYAIMVVHIKRNPLVYKFTIYNKLSKVTQLTCLVDKLLLSCHKSYKQCQKSSNSYVLNVHVLKLVSLLQFFRLHFYSDT